MTDTTKPVAQAAVAHARAQKYNRNLGQIDIADAAAEPPEDRVFRMPQDVLPEPPRHEEKAENKGRCVMIQITAVYEGYQVTVAFEGRIDQLPGTIERLRALGITPTAQPAQQWSYTPDGLPICPRHNAPMRKRERQGDTWYSHVVTGPDGEDCYCRGYKGKESPGYEY